VVAPAGGGDEQRPVTILGDDRREIGAAALY
jgi:hypothetical protein